MYWNGAAAEVRHRVESDGAVTAVDDRAGERTVAGAVVMTAMVVAVVVAVSYPVATMVAAVVATGVVVAARRQARRTDDAGAMASEQHVRTAD